MKVLTYSHSGRVSDWSASLDEVVQADFLIPAIPLDAYESTLKSIKNKISKNTVLVDVCSVKTEPIRIIRSILPDNRLVATHPLFGPESALDSLQGHSLVLCPADSDPEMLQKVEEFAKRLELEVISMSAVEHDDEMAVVQGLTFFIAHSLKDLKLHEQKLSTPSFQKLLDLAKLEKHHSNGLFFTIQAGNKQAKYIRRKFIALAEELDGQVNQKTVL